MQHVHILSDYLLVRGTADSLSIQITDGAGLLHSSLVSKTHFYQKHWHFISLTADVTNFSHNFSTFSTHTAINRGIYVKLCKTLLLQMFSLSTLILIRFGLEHERMDLTRYLSQSIMLRCLFSVTSFTVCSQNHHTDKRMKSCSLVLDVLPLDVKPIRRKWA